MKAFIRKPVFSGTLDEDLDIILSICDTLSERCAVSRVKKREAVKVVVKEDALALFSTKGKTCQTYDKSGHLLPE